VTRLLAESSRVLWHHLADLGHNHLATLAVSTIHSGCHVTMRTGESMQRVNYGNTDALLTVVVFMEGIGGPW